MSFYDNYLAQIKKDYPQVAQDFDLTTLIHPNLISSQVVKLPRESIDQVQAAVAAIYKMKRSPAYIEKIVATDSVLSSVPENAAVLMSYDFHLTEDGQPKLIEVNTNASSSLMATNSYRTDSLANPFAKKEFFADIVECFQQEFQSLQMHSPTRKLQNIAIVDDAPSGQRLYIEFLLYRELLRKAGFQCEIVDTKDLTITNDRLTGPDGLAIDLVYNRNTDFYLAHSPVLREAYTHKLACISPHPFEYALFADKKRLSEWSAGEFADTLNAQDQAALKTVLLKTWDLTLEKDHTKIWANRKNLFFKPKRAFGGKAAYRGASVTQKVFKEIQAGDYIAQEYAPPAVVHVTLEDQTTFEFKYDLRFYVYRERVQLGVARLWRGQMTNIHTVGGGLAPIQIED